MRELLELTDTFRGLVAMLISHRNPPASPVSHQVNRPVSLQMSHQVSPQANPPANLQANQPSKRTELTHCTPTTMMRVALSRLVTAMWPHQSPLAGQCLVWCSLVSIAEKGTVFRASQLASKQDRAFLYHHPWVSQGYCTHTSWATRVKFPSEGTVAKLGPS